MADLALHAISAIIGVWGSATPTQRRKKPAAGPPPPPSMKFSNDVTMPDRSAVVVDTIMTKTWRVKNDGTGAWPASTKIIFVHGDDFRPAQGEAAKVAELAAPGQEVNVSIELRSPVSPGRYSGFFRLADADGKWFGDRLYVDVFAQAAPNNSNAAASTGDTADESDSTGETNTTATYADAVATGTAGAVAAAASSVEGSSPNISAASAEPSAPEVEGHTNPSAPELEGSKEGERNEGDHQSAEGEVRTTVPGGL